MRYSAAFQANRWPFAHFPSRPHGALHIRGCALRDVAVEEPGASSGSSCYIERPDGSLCLAHFVKKKKKL